MAEEQPSWHLAVNRLLLRIGTNQVSRCNPKNKVSLTMRFRTLLLCAIFHLACGRLGAAEVTIAAQPDLSFSLPNLQINNGDSVRFENAGGFHNVRQVESDVSVTPVASGFCAPLPDCAPSADAWSTLHVFATPGIYHYVCEVHAGVMRGKITVLGNGAPTAHPQDLFVTEDQQLFITLNGTDPEGDQLAYSLSGAGPMHGTLTGFIPEFVYVPFPNYVGPDAFDFHVFDGSNGSVATISITVMPDLLNNDVPIAHDAILSTEQETAVDVALTASDPDGDLLTFLVSGNVLPSHGTLSGTPPNLQYVPNTGFFGYDHFEFSVSDGLDFSNTARVTLRVERNAPTPSSRLFAVPESAPEDIVEIDDGMEINRFAAPGTILSFPGTDGLAFDGTNLWALTQQHPELVYKLDPNSGSIIDTLQVAPGPYGGLGFGSGRVLLNDGTDHTLHIVSADSGIIERSIDYGIGLGSGGSIAGFPSSANVLLTTPAGIVLFDSLTNSTTATFPILDNGAGVASLDAGIFSAALGSEQGSLTAHDGSVTLLTQLPYALRSLGSDQGLSVQPSARYRRLFVVPRDSETDIAELDPSTGLELHRFAAPLPTLSQSRGETGLAFDGDSLWYITAVEHQFIFQPSPLFQLDPDSGEVRSRHELETGPQVDGLAALGGHIFLLEHTPNRLLKFDPETGAIQQVLDLAGLGLDLVGGLSAMDGSILVSTADGNVVALDPTDGSVNADFNASPNFFAGLGALGGEIVVAGPFQHNADPLDVPRLHFFNRQGELLRQIELPYRVAALGTDNVYAPFPRIASVTSTAGSSQTTETESEFPTPLQVRVSDAFGNGVPGVPVSFRISGDGVGAWFVGGSTHVTALSDVFGNATAPSIESGSLEGAVLVSALAGASPQFATFDLTVENLPIAINFADGFED